MSKRARSDSASTMAPAASKKTRKDAQFLPSKIATADAAAKVDKHPPVVQLMEAMSRKTRSPPAGDSVVYWMRMQDLRIADNRALSQASEQAKKNNVPVIVLFVLSPQDYIAHDRGARRIDFTLRNLHSIKDALEKLNIPLFTASCTPRTAIPSFVLSLLHNWNASHVFANIEYEVDELRRDMKVLELAQDRVACTFVHDKCAVTPGEVKTKEGRAYTVYSPWLRAWLPHLTPSARAKFDPLACAGPPAANDSSVREHPILGSLFKEPVPSVVEGFSLESDEKKDMERCWPAGEEAAHEVLERFLHTRSRKIQLGAVNPLTEGAEPPSKNPEKNSRIGKYSTERDKVDADTTSRLSPYLACGIISARHILRATIELSGRKSGELDASRDTGIGRYVQEIAWRDFYVHILANYPRVSMGRPFIEKFANVKWETMSLSEHLQAWKDGRTGVPIVDAGMRQARAMGWMHNRVRMIVAMYLVKDLMIDWRLGEKHFMEVLIDGDLASNNGGWQWSASTGVDPAPYFRIFNPYTQSHKADPTGEYIRTFVPELSQVKGDDIHDPPAKLADKLGYPRPLVNHKEARERAIRRYKNPGDE